MPTQWRGAWGTLQLRPTTHCRQSPYRMRSKAI
jgi:hypothetical protein